MSPDFSVLATPSFRRLANHLTSQHPEFSTLYEEALAILQEDPLNRTRRHPIRKLRNVRPGEGQYRIRLRRFRLRYDVRESVVELVYCGLRREDTYR